MFLLAVLAPVCFATTLKVGDGMAYSRIEEAIKAAKPGDKVEVHPSKSGYGGTALRIETPRLTIVGVGDKRTLIDGGSFEYSGSGGVPRAIFQIDADGVTIRHFELAGAHNLSFNGSGVRINGGNDATVEDCDIHGNDMGIMSGVQGDKDHVGRNQKIANCLVHENGTFKDPGYNHNLYLGGDSVTVESCEIFGSLTGHNLKCRSHFALVKYCFIHDSSNREVEFVDSKETEAPHSNAVLIGNVIEKNPKCEGNKETIRFGSEKGIRDGCLFLLNNTIVTPFKSAVVNLCCSKSSVRLVNNVVSNTQEHEPDLVQVSNGALWPSVQLVHNLLTPNYGVPRGKNGAVDSPVNSAGSVKVAPVYEDGKGRKQTAPFEMRYMGRGKWGKSDGKPFIGAG